MPKIKTELLQPGMVVTADVKNMDNMLLMPAGCELSAKHISILHAWGVAEIQVQTCEGPEESGNILQRLPPELLEQITDELKTTFWEPINQNPVQEEVFDLVLRRKAKQLLS